MKSFSRLTIIVLGFVLSAVVLFSLRSQPAIAAAPAANTTTLQPFQTSVNFTISDTNTGVATFGVPSGKRLVIEYISGQAVAPLNTTIFFGVGVVQNSVNTGHFLGSTVQPWQNDNLFTLSQPVRLYADGNTGVTLGAASNVVPSPPVSVTMVVSGHLE